MTASLAAGSVARPAIAAAQRRLLLLTALRWLPVGVTLGLTVLVPLERGMSIAAIGSILAIQGFVALALELPTGALADTLGRRPVLAASGVLAITASTLFLFADSYALFAVSLLLQGVFRVLDSGALEAWFVDAVHEHEPQAEVAAPLARAGTVLGVAIAGGALLGGLLVAWHPLPGVSALILPMLVAIGLYALYTVLLLVLVRDARDHDVPPIRPLTAMADAARLTPRTIVDGLRRAVRSRVLLGLVLVEVFWSVAMIGFETLTPLQLEGILGGEDAAAAVFGPASAAAWGLFAIGSLLASRLSGVIGVAWTAILSRILNGVFVVLMGLASGVVGLLIGYGLTYLAHGGAGPMHAALLHREADRSTRATILSLNSMVSGGAYSIGLLVLTAFAGATSAAAATVVAGAFSVLGALCYLPALRKERAGGAVDEARATSPA
ncbi:Major Facilitator Superfamily protein [Microbacterium azadirachtae]|uniref:Major Facilitator Superfamily protein n=1 Tax=Microbacterium azadirachtae TaxID=582680 RepID=A0A1I6G443_9MICO|nr:MFS transporter [Microbacterium azadirachtae]SFR36983.1 Major Facilitator Superfamily protein [Microbacterium azadirachtae]